MARIFISYAHADQSAAKRIVEALAREGCEAWWDHDIPPGQTWDDVIGARISAAHIVIVLWSSRSVTSNFVKEEAQLALDANKLLPLLIENVEPPLGFRRVQAADLSDWRGDSGNRRWRVVLGTIRARLGAPLAPRAAPRRRRPSIAAAAASALVLCAVGGFYLVAANLPAANGGGEAARETPEPAAPPVPAFAGAQPASTSAKSSTPRRDRAAQLLSPGVESVAYTLWQGPVFRSSGRMSEWAIRFNGDGTAALDFMDGRGFIDSGDWVWTQDGRSVRLTHRPSGNYAEATIHDRELSGVLTTPASPRDSGTFRFIRR